MVGEKGHFVVRDEVSGDGFAVIWSKEFGRGVPELSQLVRFYCIQGIFKLDVTLVDKAVELRPVFDGGKVEGLTGVEDCGMLREVAVIGVVQAV